MREQPEKVLTSRAKVYVACVCVAGAAATAHSIRAIIVGHMPSEWLVFAALALVTGSFTIKIPGLPARFSVSETFIFACVLLFGPAAATITIALDGFIVSYRRQHQLHRLLFNAFEGACSIWVASQVFFTLARVPPLHAVPTAPAPLILPLVALTATYFLFNSTLTALAVAFETGSSPAVLWRQHFLWLSLNYIAGASVSLLLVTAMRQVSFGAVAVIAPILVVSYLTFRASMGRVDDATQHAAEVNRLYRSAVETLAIAIDAKDEVTHGHIRRVQRCAVGLARALGITDEGTIQAIDVAALLHDAGKLAVPEHILNKPGRLTVPEFERMKLHVKIGAEIVSAIDFPYPVVPIVQSHHENWDGSGYPDGRAGSDIPIGARILAVVDCFDALTSDRPYRRKLSRDEAVKVLRERRGTMYDPTVVDTFLAVYQDLMSADLEPPTHHRALAEISRSSAHKADDAVQAGEQTALETTEEMMAVCTLSRAGAVGTFTDAAFLLGTHVRRIIPGATCVFYAFDPATDHLVARHVAGAPAVGLQGLRIPAGHRLSGWVAVNRQAMVNSDAALDLGEAGDVVDLAFKSCLSVPLLAAETLVGVLTLYSTSPAAFSEEQARVLQLLTPSIAATLQAALEFEGRNSGRDATTRPLAVVRGNRPHSEPTRPATGGAGLHVVTRH
jgi:putative nucleotidyltransferase with HDIG domain